MRTAAMSGLIALMAALAQFGTAPPAAVAAHVTATPATGTPETAAARGGGRAVRRVVRVAEELRGRRP